MNSSVSMISFAWNYSTGQNRSFLFGYMDSGAFRYKGGDVEARILHFLFTKLLVEKINRINMFINNIISKKINI